MVNFHKCQLLEELRVTHPTYHMLCRVMMQGGIFVVVIMKYILGTVEKGRRWCRVEVEGRDTYGILLTEELIHEYGTDEASSSLTFEGFRPITSDVYISPNDLVRWTGLFVESLESWEGEGYYMVESPSIIDFGVTETGQIKFLGALAFEYYERAEWVNRDRLRAVRLGLSRMFVRIGEMMSEGRTGQALERWQLAIAEIQATSRP